jgi:PEP-CTERM/exosortase A-associated glycosyltransferase
MRILHVLDHSIPLHSGYTFRTAAILREQRAMGWETLHLTSPKHTAPSGPEEDVDGLRFYRTPWNPGVMGSLPLSRELLLMSATARRLDEIVRQTKPTVLHAHSPVLNAMPALWVGRRHRVPVVYEVRAFWEDAAVDHGIARPWGPRYRAVRALETFALKRADAVTCICEGLRRDILKRGIPDHKITVIPNAVDVQRFCLRDRPESDLKRRLGLESATVLGFIGSFYAYEGLAMLLDAFADVLATKPDARLLLVGGGPDESRLRERVDRLALAGKVVFTGRVPHSQVDSYYELIDVLVYPRLPMRLTDLVTPLKPLEAMAQGRLVVASDVGGHRELIRDWETGVLFKAGDREALTGAVREVLSRRQEWPLLREAARRFVEAERTWPLSVSRYGPVYAALTAAAA